MRNEIIKISEGAYWPYLFNFYTAQSSVCDPETVQNEATFQVTHNHIIK